MKRLGELPTEIPIFPLPGALLLPRARLPLHIFEPRYLAMVEASLATTTRLIGMIQPRDAPQGATPRLQMIGCAGRISGLSETEDGRYMITLTGISRFRLLAESTHDTPFRTARVDWAGFERDRGATEADTGLVRETFMNQLRRFFEARGLSTDWGALREAEDELLINSLSMLCPFSHEDKQALLEAPSLQTRRETLGALIEFALHSGDDNDELMQ